MTTCLAPFPCATCCTKSKNAVNTSVLGMIAKDNDMNVDLELSKFLFSNCCKFVDTACRRQWEDSVGGDYRLYSCNKNMTRSKNFLFETVSHAWRFLVKGQFFEPRKRRQLCSTSPSTLFGKAYYLASLRTVQLSTPICLMLVLSALVEIPGGEVCLPFASLPA